MFRLEKIFQQDDSFYINIAIFLKSFAVFLSIYIFSILEFNSIFDLLNYDIYKTSKYFYLSLIFYSFLFVIFIYFRNNEKKICNKFFNFFVK